VLLPGIPQELRFPGFPDKSFSLFDSRNPSRNYRFLEGIPAIHESLVASDFFI
jgi:hypothetical protein